MPAHSSTAPRPSAPATTGDPLAEILAAGALRSIYQPIIDLASGSVVAVEALVRGPEGPLESPDALFAAARRHDLLGALDRACQEAAAVGARRAGLAVPLFLNVEPEAMEGDLGGLARASAVLGGRVPLVIEITERALTARPAELIDLLARARALGWGIALDDVGTDPASLALLPVVRPDVVKLDRRLVQSPASSESAAILSAVAAECERTGAVVLAEGIEDSRHRRAAAAAGATLGQGYLFGRPAALPAGLAGAWLPPRVEELQPPAREATPFTIVAARRPTRPAGWPFLLQVSHMLETHARGLGAEALIVSAFQSAERFTALTATRYAALARDAAFVAALGAGMAPEPAPGVHGACLPDGHPLTGEWSVVVLGPHFAAALVAEEIDGPGRRPDFRYAVTYDRDLVVRAATALLRQIARS